MKKIVLLIITILLVTGCGLLTESYYMTPEKNVDKLGARRFKTNYNKANEIVLNGVTYKLEEDTLQKYLDNGFVATTSYDEEISNSKKIVGYFPDYPEANVYLEFHTPDYRTKTKSKDCVVNYVQVYFRPNTANKYYWKFIDFTVDENTTKTQINNYFNLATNGSKSVMLYTDKNLISLECGSISETHQYSNIFQIRAQKYTENMRIPEWEEQ